MEDKVSITLTKDELRNCINDLIAYCWDLEDKNLDKDNTYGYFSRKRLIKKLKLIEQAYYPECDTMQG